MISHCKKVGDGDKTITYPGKYLYRGVIQEKDILNCENGRLTFRDRPADHELREAVLWEIESTNHEDEKNLVILLKTHPGFNSNHRINMEADLESVFKRVFPRRQSPCLETNRLASLYFPAEL